MSENKNGSLEAHLRIREAQTELALQICKLSDEVGEIRRALQKANLLPMFKPADEGGATDKIIERKG